MESRNTHTHTHTVTVTIQPFHTDTHCSSDCTHAHTHTHCYSDCTPLPHTYTLTVTAHPVHTHTHTLFQWLHTPPTHSQLQWWASPWPPSQNGKDKCRIKSRRRFYWVHSQSEISTNIPTKFLFLRELPKSGILDQCNEHILKQKPRQASDRWNK